MYKLPYLKTKSAYAVWVISLIFAVYSVISFVIFVQVFQKITSASAQTTTILSADDWKAQKAVEELANTIWQIFYSAEDLFSGVLLLLIGASLLIFSIFYLVTVVANVLDAVGLTLVIFAKRGTGIVRFNHFVLAACQLFNCIFAVLWVIIFYFIAKSTNVVGTASENAFEYSMVIVFLGLIAAAVFFAMFRFHSDIAFSMKVVRVNLMGGDITKTTHLAGISTAMGIMCALWIVGINLLNFEYGVIAEVTALLTMVQYFLIRKCYNDLKKYNLWA